MVYSRSVITSILAAGAISSVLAVPVPASPASGAHAVAAADPSLQRRVLGLHHLKKLFSKNGNPQPAAAAGDQALPAGNAVDPNMRRRQIHGHHHRLEEALDRVDHAKDRLIAAERHLHDLFHKEDEGEFVSKHRVYRAKHRLRQAKHRLHIAEKHLHHLKDELEESDLDRKYRHRHDHFRFGKALAPPSIVEPFAIEEGLRDAAAIIAALQPSQPTAAPGFKPEEAPVAFEIAIATVPNGLPTASNPTPSASVVAPPQPGGQPQNLASMVITNPLPGIVIPCSKRSKRRVSYGDDLD